MVNLSGLYMYMAVVFLWLFTLQVVPFLLSLL